MRGVNEPDRLTGYASPMDFRKLGEQAGRLRESAREKLGDRAEPENLKRDAKEFREILAGDGSLAEKAKEAKEKLADPERPGDAEVSGRNEADSGGSDRSQ